MSKVALERPIWPACWHARLGSATPGGSLRSWSGLGGPRTLTGAQVRFSLPALAQAAVDARWTRGRVGAPPTPDGGGTPAPPTPKKTKRARRSVCVVSERAAGRADQETPFPRRASASSWALAPGTAPGSIRLQIWATGRTPRPPGVCDSSAWFSRKSKRAVSPPIQVNLTECLLSDIAENAACFTYSPYPRCAAGVRTVPSEFVVAKIFSFRSQCLLARSGPGNRTRTQTGENNDKPDTLAFDWRRGGGASSSPFPPCPLPSERPIAPLWARLSFDT